MLHVLPAGTYGLRPAVNRSNTRTRCGTLCVPVVVCTAMHRPYTVSTPRPSRPLTTLSSRPSPPLFAGTTSPSDYLHLVPRVPSLVPSASRSPDAFTVRDRFLNLCGLSPRIIAPCRVLEKVGEIDVSTLRITSHFDKPVRYFGFWSVASLPASFVLYRRAISAEFSVSCLKSHKSPLRYYLIILFRDDKRRPSDIIHNVLWRKLRVYIYLRCFYTRLNSKTSNNKLMIVN